MAFQNFHVRVGIAKILMPFTVKISYKEVKILVQGNSNADCSLFLEFPVTCTFRFSIFWMIVVIKWSTLNIARVDKNTGQQLIAYTKTCVIGYRIEQNFGKFGKSP